MNPVVVGAASKAAPVIIQQADATRRRILHGVLFLIILILGIIVTIKIVRAFKKPPNANYNENGGAIPDNWLPGPVTKDLFNAIDGIAMTNTKDLAYSKFNALNDNQMIAVYNDWLAQGFDEKGWPSKHGTLTTALNNENGYQMFDDVNNMDLMISNLNRLQLK